MAKFKTKVEVTMVEGKPTAITTIDAFPRGSGNRQVMERLALAVRGHQMFGRHVDQVKVSGSRVRVFWRASWSMMKDFALFDLAMEELQCQDVPGQQHLPFGVGENASVTG